MECISFCSVQKLINGEETVTANKEILLDASKDGGLEIVAKPISYHQNAGQNHNVKNLIYIYKGV